MPEIPISLVIAETHELSSVERGKEIRAILAEDLSMEETRDKLMQSERKQGGFSPISQLKKEISRFFSLIRRSS